MSIQYRHQVHHMKIHCLQTGWVQIKYRHQVARHLARPARVLDVLLDRQWTEHLPIGCWLIEHPEGLIMVDTGESSHANDKGYQPWWHPFMQYCERRGVHLHEEVGACLKAKGFNPLDVKWVVMTHMHGDHAGGLHHFPNSQFILSETESRLIQAPNAVFNGYLTMHYPDWFKPRSVAYHDGAFASFERSTALTQDGKVRLVPTTGHTMGHQSVIVDMGDHYVLIGGDASYSEQAMLEGIVDGVALDAKWHQDSTARMRKLCQIKPTITQFAHDEQSAYRLEQQIFTTI